MDLDSMIHVGWSVENTDGSFYDLANMSWSGLLLTSSTTNPIFLSNKDYEQKLLHNTMPMPPGGKFGN